MSIVLDTCALIWWSLDPEKLSEPAEQACQQMEQDQNGLVPSMAIWEIAIKIKNQKLDLGIDFETYLGALQKSSAIQLIPIDEKIWLDSVKLNWAHRDPADRVVVAIANCYNAPIVTADQTIKKFYSKTIW